MSLVDHDGLQPGDLIVYKHEALHPDYVNDFAYWCDENGKTYVMWKDEIEVLGDL